MEDIKTVPQPEPVVSAVIPTYNCAPYLVEALDSVLNQTFGACEAIVVDDGSTDNTEDVVGAYLRRHPGRVIYIRKENEGQAVARNTGIEAARGQFIAMLDADDRWHPMKLERQLPVLEVQPQVGLVHSNAMKITEEGRPIGPVLLGSPNHRSGHLFESMYLRELHLPMATVLFRKECCNRVGLFDVDPIALGCEDREFWLRIAREFRIEYVDEILADYRVRRSSHSKDFAKVLEGRVYVIEKHRPEGRKGSRMRRLALARSYRDFGDKQLWDGNFVESRRAYRRAIALHPASPWPWINLVKAALRLSVDPHSRTGLT